MKKIYLLGLLLLNISFVQAADQIRVCGKYQRMDSTWSHGYKLTGYYLTGSELDDQVNQNIADQTKKYFLIKWRKGGYTFMEVGSNFLSAIQGSSKIYRDQTGKPWEIRQGWNGCR